MRHHALYCRRETAEQRLIEFCNLIKNWKERGYDKRKRILINSQYEVIDGLHRITVAKYFGEEYVVCDVFSNKISATSLQGNKALLTEQALRESDFDKEECEILRKVNQMLKATWL